MVKRLILGGLAVVVSGAGASAPAQVRNDVSIDWPVGTETIEIPFETYRQWIAVPVSIHGSRPLRLLLDSGAPLILIPQETLADSLDLQVTGRAMVGGAGDGAPVPADFATGVSASIGGLGISGAQALIGPAKTPLRGLDGAFGGSLFSNAVVELDFESGVVRIHRPETFEYDGGGAILPLEVLPNGQPYLLDVPVNIDGEWIVADIHMDTGRGGTMQVWGSPPESASFRTIESIVSWGARGSELGVFGRVAGLRFGPYELRDVISSFAENSQLAGTGPGFEDLQAAIGMQILRRFRTIIDFRNERVILEPNSAFDDPFPFNTNGIRLKPWAPGDQALEVAFVMAGSPAEDAGLQVGDRIAAIDGVRVDRLETGQVLDIWERPPGLELRLSIERGDERFERRLTTRQLI